MPSIFFEASEWWSSPYINHFVSADTVVSSYANPQSLNRYSYVLNNPIRYSDSTGHKQCEGQDSECSGWENVPSTLALAHQIIRRHGVKLSGKWSTREITAIAFAVTDVGTLFASERHRSEKSADAFTRVYGELTLSKVGSYTYNGKKYTGGCLTSGTTISCASINYPRMQSLVNNVVHEFGHAFDPGSGIPQVFINNRSEILHDNHTAMWQAHVESSSSETFADFFVAWTYGVWGPKADDVWKKDPSAGSAMQWMTTNMDDWLNP